MACLPGIKKNKLDFLASLSKTPSSNGYAFTNRKTRPKHRQPGNCRRGCQAWKVAHTSGRNLLPGSLFKKLLPIVTAHVSYTQLGQVLLCLHDRALFFPSRLMLCKVPPITPLQSTLQTTSPLVRSTRTPAFKVITQHYNAGTL